ncbi:aldehyde dehydrogenase (NADP(+)) [Saccharomonospora sp. NB11]|jgi:NADP-dependent aldehyde dehydrogenase|uniref:aldehyde dehydrogenase (NADP(+)) n=1 Tax=Saccharomonospora sp. NB11 TaxID=1642298 RepID=UPI0018D0E8D6|nr:aldehyde dehydrogenase (NADP(+)) [Saccharomonospora sp. NB11]
MTDVTDTLLTAAAEAARPWAQLPDTTRAKALEAVADALDAAADELVPLAQQESHLPEARLRGELVRTTFQLRSFAGQVRDGFEVIEDEPDPDWPTGPRPALRRVLLPLGPVVVFAASNFPFAFSVAGGDTASALAAGCPVVVKAHPGHPKLSDATAAIVRTALAEAGAPEGTFALFHGEADGRDAVLDPRTKAVAFTGSLRGGRALFDLAVSRPEPIPFYGELGSVNPVFVTRAAAQARGEEIATGYVDSFTLGTGQFCTKPGLLLVPSDSRLPELAAEHARSKNATAMLNDRITDNYTTGLEALRGHPSVRVLVEGALGEDGPTPTLLATTAADLLADPDALATECFGPTSLVVTYDDDEQLLAVARSLEGQLTGTVHGEESDDVARPLLTELADRVGRVLWNGWPTGVSVTPAMHHGGPYPATTSPLHTSVGITASARFLRPVAFQNVPSTLLPR